MQYQKELTLTTKKQPQYTNQLNFQLKQKKKATIALQAQLQHQIKQHFSQMTNALMDRQNILIQQLTSSTLNLFQQIDHYLAMSQPQKKYHHHSITQLLNRQLKVNAYQFNNIEKFINKSFQITLLDTTIINESSKNMTDSQLIQKLEQKIQNLMIKQQKLNQKIMKLESKHQIKQKEESKLQDIWNLKIERLESENKILKEINQSCSNQIISINQENLSIKTLIKNTHLSQQSNLEQTEKKALIQPKYSEQITQLQTIIKELQAKNQTITNEIQGLKDKNFSLNQYIMQLEKINTNQSNQIHQISQNSDKIYRDYELSCKKKIEIQQLFNQQKIVCSQLKLLCSDLNNQNKTLQTQILDLRNQQNIQSLIMKKLQAQVQLLRQRQNTLQKQSKQQMQIYLKVVHEKDQQIAKLKQKISEIEKKHLKKIKELQEVSKQIQKCQEQKSHQISRLQQEMKQNEKKQKSTYRKSVNKTIKNLQKEHQDSKKLMINEFNNKYAILHHQVQQIRNKLRQVQQLAEHRAKIGQNRIKILKQRYNKQIQEMIDKGKGKISSQIVEKYIESSSAFALKVSQIKQLKQQVNILKKGKFIDNRSSILIDQKLVEGQLFQIQKKLINTKSELEINILKQKLNQAQLLIQHKSKQIENQLDKVQYERALNTQLKEQIISLRKMIKNKQLQQEERLQRAKDLGKNQSEVQIIKMRKSLLECQNQCRQVKTQIQKKKQLINQYKKIIKQREEQIKKVKLQLQSQHTEVEKLRKNIKQISHKQQCYKQMKQKLESLKEVQKENENLKKTLQQRQKLHKYEINKKDQLIRNIKIENEEYKPQKNNEQQIQNLKQIIRKLKGEVQRKDQLMKHNKHKSSKQNQQLQQKLMKYQIQLKKIKGELQTVERKSDQIKLNFKKQQSKKIILLNVIRKVYQMVISKYTNTYQTKILKTQSTPNKYAEGLSILQLTMEDLCIQQPSEKAIPSDNIKKLMFTLQKVLQQENLSLNSITSEFEEFLR